MKHSQKQLAELKKIAEKIAMADFEKTTEEHQFSSDYQVKKAELLEQLTQESPSPKGWKKTAGNCWGSLVNCYSNDSLCRYKTL